MHLYIYFNDTYACLKALLSIFIYPYLKGSYPYLVSDMMCQLVQFDGIFLNALCTIQTTRSGTSSSTNHTIDRPFSGGLTH